MCAALSSNIGRFQLERVNGEKVVVELRKGVLTYNAYVEGECVGQMMASKEGEVIEVSLLNNFTSLRDNETADPTKRIKRLGELFLSFAQSLGKTLVYANDQGKSYYEHLGFKESGRDAASTHFHSTKKTRNVALEMLSKCKAT